MLHRRPAAALAALTAALPTLPGVATGAGAASPDSDADGRRFALLLLIGGGLAAAAGSVVQQRRSTG
jgi:hypothetical protein